MPSFGVRKNHLQAHEGRHGFFEKFSKQKKAMTETWISDTGPHPILALVLKEMKYYSHWEGRDLF
jgi:hypothetical protein